MDTKNIELKENKLHGHLMFPLTVYSNDLMWGHVNFHWHDEIEIIYVKKGTFTLGIGMQEFQAKKDNCYFVNRGLLHSAKSFKDKDTLHYAILFPIETFNSTIYDFCQSKFFDPLNKNEMIFPTTIDVTTHWGQKIIKEIKEIIEFSENKYAGWELAFKGGILKIISILASENQFIMTSDVQKSQKDYKTKLLKESLTHIHNHFHENISSKNLAKELNMSTQYYCRFFKNLTGKTPMDYVNQYRVNEASKILQNEVLPITEVCFRVGFENTSYFIKKFKEYKGCTPFQFKKISIPL